MDSNHRSPARKSRFLLRKANCGGPNGGSQKGLFLMRYRWFESISLQRRVSGELRNRLHSGVRQPVSTGRTVRRAALSRIMLGAGRRPTDHQPPRPRRQDPPDPRPLRPDRQPLRLVRLHPRQSPRAALAYHYERCGRLIIPTQACFRHSSCYISQRVSSHQTPLYGRRPSWPAQLLKSALGQG
jgi:hypothetical protein